MANWVQVYTNVFLQAAFLSELYLCIFISSFFKYDYYWLITLLLWWTQSKNLDKVCHHFRPGYKFCSLNHKGLKTLTSLPKKADCKWSYLYFLSPMKGRFSSACCSQRCTKHNGLFWAAATQLHAASPSRAIHLLPPGTQLIIFLFRGKRKIIVIFIENTARYSINNSHFSPQYTLIDLLTETCLSLQYTKMQ